MDKKIIVIIMVVLVCILSVTLFIHMNNNQDNIEKYKNETVIFSSQGEEIAQLTMEEIMNMGEEEVTAVLDTSDTDPEEYQYTGVLLKKILEELNIEYKDKEAIIASAVDGFNSAIPMSKIIEDDNVYLVYMWQGKPLGTREEDGKGPFMIIIRNDQFSQNWCKYVVGVDCQ